MAAAAGGVPFCVRVFETVVLVGFAAAAAAYAIPEEEFLGARRSRNSQKLVLVLVFLGCVKTAVQ